MRRCTARRECGSVALPSSCARLAIVLLVAAFATTSRPAQIFAADPPKTSEAGESAGTTDKGQFSAKAAVAFDPKTAVAALESRNRPPKKLGFGSDAPDFSNGFDFADQDRVHDAIAALYDHVEEAWPEMVNHLADKRYSITLARLGDDPHNYTVGAVCFAILSDFLTCPYFDELPKGARARTDLRFLARFLTPDELKKWCEERSTKPLYELQIEMCKSEIDTLPKFGWTATEKEQQDSAAAINRQIKSLSEAKKAMRPSKSYPGIESKVVIDQKTANAIRSSWERARGTAAPPK